MGPKRSASKEPNAQSKTKKPKKTNNIENEEMKVLGKSFPDLGYRSSPRQFVKAVKKFNDHQKQAVARMGFATLLKMMVKEIPIKLAHWCVTSFEPESCSFITLEKERVHITEEDEWLALGFPKGEKSVQRKTHSADNVEIDEWAEKIGKSKYLIKSKDVVEAMMADKEGGELFCISFMTLVESVFIENSPDGYIKPKIMSNLMDIDSIKDYNWSNYIINCLIRTVLAWRENTAGKFTGPLLFLIMFYVDRVVHLERKVDRVFPTVHAWNGKLLRQRQKDEMEKSKGFGKGRMEARLNVTQEMLDSFNHQTTSILNKNSTDEGEANIGVNDGTHDKLNKEDAYINDLISCMKDASSSVAKFLQKLTKASENTMLNPRFKIAFEASKFLVPANIEARPQEDDGLISSQAVLDDDPQWDECLNQMMETWEIMQEYPSFSMGFTQLFADLENENEFNKHSGGETMVTDQIQHDEFETEADTSEKDDMGLTQLIAAVDKQTYMEREVQTEVRAGDEIDTEEHVLEEHSMDKSSSDFEDEPDVELLKYVVKGKKVTNRMPKTIATRTSAEKKKSSKLSSPYVVTVKKPTKKLLNDARSIYYWIIHDKTTGGAQYVYEDERTHLTMEDLRTMAPSITVRSAVVDAWCSFLNSKEQEREADAPYRFYFTTYPCSFTIVDKPKAWTDEQAEKEMLQRLGLELKNNPKVKMEELDLVFVPICMHFHYYVMCFDLAEGKTVLIDNSNQLDKKDITAKYGETPNKVVKIFIEFLQQNNCQERGEVVASTKIERLKMKWRSSTNHVDCGVFAMRHMETYKGETAEKWEIELTQRSKHALKILRMEMSQILMGSKLNKNGKKFIAIAHNFFHKNSKDKNLDMVKYLEKYRG